MDMPSYDSYKQYGKRLEKRYENCKCKSNKNGIYRLIDAVIYSTRGIIKLLILINTYPGSIINTYSSSN